MKPDQVDVRGLYEGSAKPGSVRGVPDVCKKLQEAL